MSEGCGQILHSFFVIEWKRRKGTDVEKVTGYVEHIVFRNEENGYTVFHLENEDGEVTCVGNLNFITEGEMLELEGEYVNHSVYGNQLKVSAYRVKEPEDLVSIERYLGSGAIKGIGLQMISRESDSEPQMRSRQESGFIRIQITGSGADCFTFCSRQLQRDISICLKNYFYAGQRFCLELK